MDLIKKKHEYFQALRLEEQRKKQKAMEDNINAAVQFFNNEIITWLKNTTEYEKLQAEMRPPCDLRHATREELCAKWPSLSIELIDNNVSTYKGGSCTVMLCKIRDDRV